MEYTKLTYVDVPCGNTFTRVTQRVELEKTLLSHHKEHFAQAQETPFATNEVIGRFGLAADTEYASAFRSGDRSEYLQWKDPFAKQFLAYVQPAPSDPPTIDVTIDLEHVKNGFKIWQERTTTSPAGRVIPLYKL